MPKESPSNFSLGWKRPFALIVSDAFTAWAKQHLAFAEYGSLCLWTDSANTAKASK